jgi:hypothetical protein
MRPASVAGILLVLLVTGSTPLATAELPLGRGVLLPLQDRVGEESVARLTETLLQRELETHRDLAETENVRAVLRALRIRNASDEPLDRLAVLADRLGAEWFFLPTLHEAVRGRSPQRQDGGELTSPALEDAADSPQFVLSALVLRHDSSELWSAGLEAASGRDGERALGLGEIDTLEALLQNAIRGLVAEAAAPRVAPGRARLRRRRGGYLRAANPPSTPARVAVIPMDSVAIQNPSASAELATAALYAALDEFGFKALLPGLVRTLREQTGQGQYGAVNRREWKTLGRDGGANWVATGTVETYRRGRGRTPDPWVAFSVRFLDTGDGRIGWLDGLERTGSDTAASFERGRIYSTGDLAHQMMRSLFASMEAGSGADRTAKGD